MEYPSNRFHRRSIRLKGYDYAGIGRYFITINIQNHVCLLGSIRNQTMVHNNAGAMIDNWWQKIPGKFSGIRLDEYIIMPNHFHAIIANIGVGADQRVCPGLFAKTIGASTIDLSTIDVSKPCGTKQPDDTTQFIGIEGEHEGSPLHRVVQWFKTMTTNEYIRNVKSNGWPPFDGKLWQRNYYEHIIRNDDAYERIKKYIMENPIKWGK